MKIMMMSKFFIGGVLVVAAGTAHAGELKNPLDRDEDISGAAVEVDVQLNEDGFYEYIYTIRNPESSKGTIGGFGFGLGCSQEFGESGLPAQDDGQRFNIGAGGEPGERKPRTPAIVRAGKGIYGITRGGAVQWGVHIGPGESWRDMRVISPVEPGLRRYRLDPEIDTNPEIWDYASLTKEEREQAPSTTDFRVTGMIEGPACPGVTPPPEAPRFAGKSPGPEEVNDLLTYSEPLRDRLRVDRDQRSLTMTIHYDERIDPETFRVQPAAARRHFDPEPGGRQTLEVPLSGPLTRLQLEVHPRKSDLPRDEDPYHHSFKDRDVFEIRRRDMQEPPGRDPEGPPGQRE